MKLILKIGVALSICSLLLTSCNDDDMSALDFGIEETTFVIAATGGSESVNVSSDQSWTASTSDAWILISPSNGTASTQCNIRVDSTLLSDVREGKVVFTTSGESREVTISQDGFDKFISAKSDQDGFVLPSFEDYEDQFFEVDVTTNIAFNIDLSDEMQTWLSFEPYVQSEMAKYRPRTTTVRFRWETNSRPEFKVADIKFIGSGEGEELYADTLNINQEAADEIIPSRAGDSLSVLAIKRGLKSYLGSSSGSLNMTQWSDVTLWTKRDIKLAIEAESDQERIDALKTFEGRVKSVRFFLFDTKHTIPYEIQFLTAAESIEFLGNSNHQLNSIVLGSEITKLRYLKHLSIDAYGLVGLPPVEDLKNLKYLESLSLASNLFNSAPVDKINPTVFPMLTSLNMVSCRRLDSVLDLSTNLAEDIGLGGPLPIEWLVWEGLEILKLSNNFFEGSIPDLVEDSRVSKYTQAEADELERPDLVGTIKVLPNCIDLALNLNRLTGDIPEWLLKHPNIEIWNPIDLIYNQEGRDTEGRKGGFDNVPSDNN